MADTRFWDPQTAFWARKGKGGGPERRFSARLGSSPESHGHSTSKVPPFWEPRLEQAGYPFRIWLQDVRLWSGGTELALVLQAPAVAQRLGGTARDLVRQVPVAELRDGRLDPVTGAQETGLQILLRGLERRHGGFAVETSTRCIIELLQFKRKGAESIDEALSRFETCRMQTQTLATGFDLPVPVVSWLLLEALRVPRASWPLVLTPWHNQLPVDDQGLRQLMESVRHQGHIAEHPIAGNYSWNRSYHTQGLLDWTSGGAPPTNQSWPLCDDDGYEWGTGHPSSTDWSEPAAESYYDEDGWMACSSCGVYYEDGDDTETEDEADPSSQE